MGKLTLSLLVIAASVFANVKVVTSANILFLMPIATKSETHLLTPIAQALLEKGHSMTIVTPASSHLKHANLTEIVPVKPLDFGDVDPLHPNILEGRKSKDDLSALLSMDMSYVTERCHVVYRHKEMQPIIQMNHTFDLILTSAFFSECYLGLIHNLQAPYVMLSSMPPPKFVADVVGLRVPLSFVPNPFMEFTDRMSLSERLGNTMSSWMFALLSYYHFYPIFENVYKQYLGYHLPGVDAMRANVSMVFSNTHFSINYPRPTMPDLVEIGGVHCKKAKPLPKDLEEFVSGGKNGFIFFSLGTVVREDSLPKETIQIFINVFSRLKQRVLWKWASDDIPDLPSHVKVSKWLPQQDVLGHPNLKLFISHGGLLSTQESTYHAVPVLGIPLFVDQDVNMKSAEEHGYALKLEILDLTEEMLENAINRMINESSFTQKAKLASEIFRDQLETPVERAVFWMEYLIKYKGAPHLRSGSRALTYFEYHSFDIQLIFIAVIGSIVAVAWKIISWMLGFVNNGDDDRRRRRKLLKKYQ